MTRYGLLSDIHANVNSLLCAFAVLEKCAIDTIYHLGDIAGGRDSPNQTVDVLIKKGVEGVMGNHDLVELFFPTEPWCDSAREYLAKLPRRMQREGILFTHENPLDVKFGQGYWIRGSYIRNGEDAKRVFEGTVGRIMAVGHTHLASVFSDHEEEYFLREDGKINLDQGKRYILNPGSVGRPRDADTSSVGILDTERQTFEVIRF